MSQNIYRAARMAAAEHNNLLSNRERACGLVYCSGESLADYETDKSIPPCHVVQQMVEVYQCPDLKGQHIRTQCPLMNEYGSERPSQLAEAALGWAVAFGSVVDISREFAAVARDGRISANERPAANIIRSKAVEIMRIMQETIDAIDTAMGSEER